jgi:hypothetical protein
LLGPDDDVKGKILDGTEKERKLQQDKNQGLIPHQSFPPTLTLNLCRRSLYQDYFIILRVYSRV